MTIAKAQLTPAEIERYKRHLVLRDVGGQGQQALKAARVLVIGAGGLGSPIVTYLAAAGVGTIGVVDDDTVSLDNLQRQIAHATADIGRPKVDSARDRITALNPHVDVVTHATRIDAGNALGLIAPFDIVVDGSDNFATRYLVSDACCLARKTLVFAALGPFDGYLTTFKPFAADPDGQPLPTYRCLFPQAPSAGTVANCAEVGILGAVAGVIGTLAAVEVLKEIIGIGAQLTCRLLIYDALASRFETLNYQWDADNPLTGAHPTIVDLSAHRGAAAPVCAA